MDTLEEIGACGDDCPIRRCAEMIGGKWTTLVIRELLPGKKRYSEIQRALPGISPKVLTARLRQLETERLVTRTVYPTIPPTAEYELTRSGRKLEEILLAMARFGLEMAEAEARSGERAAS